MSNPGQLPGEGGSKTLPATTSQIPIDVADVSTDRVIEDTEAWRDFSANGGRLLSEDPHAAVQLLLRLVKEGDQRNREANNKIRHLQELFDDVEHIRIRVARAEEGRLVGERSQHQLQTRLEMTEENIRELQYKSKEPEESGQKAAMMEEVQDRLSSVEDAVNKQPEWFATYKKRVVDLADRFDRMDSRLVQVEAGPNGLKSKVAKTDVDLTAVEQLPRLMIQMMETQAKIEIHSNGMSAVEKSMAKMSQEVQNLRSELKSGSSSQTKQPSAQVPIPLPLSSVLKESQLGNERTGEYQEAVEQFKQRVEELMRVESRVMRCEANLGRLTGNVADSQSVANIAKLKATQALDAAEMACTTASAAQSSIGRLTANVEEAFAVANEFGSKADTAVALARKAGRSGMDAQRLIEEQREKGHTLAAKIETAWSKVEKHEVSLLGCVTRIELEKTLEASQISQRNSRRRMMFQHPYDESSGLQTHRKMPTLMSDEDSRPGSPQSKFDRGMVSPSGVSGENKRGAVVSFDSATLSRSNSQLQKDIGKVQEHLEFVTRQVMEVQQVMDMVASKEDILQTRAQMAEVEQQLGDLDRRLTGRSVTEMDVRHTIETALDTFEDRLKAAEGRGAKAEAHMRQASTKTSQADDRIQELSTHITALRRKLVDMESELNVKVDKAGVESTVMQHISSSMPTTLPDPGAMDVTRGPSRRGISHATKAALIAMKQKVAKSKTRINMGSDSRHIPAAQGGDAGSANPTRRILQGGPHDQRHEADSSENSAIDQESSSKDLATIVNADTLLELVRLSESSMTAMADMENRMKALQETISVKADRNDVTLLNKSLMSIQQDTLQITAKHVEGIMLQAQQERGKQSDMMQHSLQSLRVDIGQLLQEMIVDDDSQHKKLKEVLQEMLALKAAANDSKSEVESLRRAKFRTPIQLLFPDQFDGGSMITSVKMWSEQEIESLNKQMVSIRNTLSMKTNHEELAKVKDLVEETRRQMFTHATTTNLQASETNELRRKTERVIASSETLKRDVALVRNHLNTELVKVTVDTAQAIRDMEQCQRFVKDVSAGVANLKRTVPQAVAVLRNAIKDMKSQAAAKDAEIESAILSYSDRLQVLEKRSTEEGSSGASSGSRSEATKPTPDKLNHLENDMASILHRMAMVEKAVSSLFQGVSQTGQAVASVAESLHATDYQNDRFSAILQQLIDEDEGEGADQDGNMGQEMQVNSKNGSVRGADPQPRGQTPSTKQAVSLQGIEEWTMPNLALTKRVPQKANASWVLKLEGAISQRLEELDHRLHAVETTFSNLWQRKVDRSELQGLQRVIAQQRSDTGRLKDIVADGLSGARSGSPVYIPDVLTKFPGGFGKQKEQKGHRGASTAPSSPTPTLMSERQAPPSISRKLVQGGGSAHAMWGQPIGMQQQLAADVPTGEEDRMGSPVPIARRFWDRGATAPGVGIGRDAGRMARSLPLMPKSMPQ